MVPTRISPQPVRIGDNVVMADAFATRFAAVRARFGPLVWGLDPAGSLLDAWGLGDTPEGLDRFADIVLEAAIGTVGLVKLQAAFYERHGWRGFRTLQRLIAHARSAGLLVIVDANAATSGAPTSHTPRRISGPMPRSEPTPSPSTPTSVSAPWMPSFPARTKQGAVCSS